MRIKFDKQCAAKLFSGMVFSGLMIYTLSSTFTISGVTSGLILASIGWVGNIILKKNRIEPTLVNILPLLFLLTILISIGRSGVILVGFDRFRSIAEKILLYYIIVSEVFSRRSLRWLIRGLLIGAIIAVVYELGMLVFDTSRIKELALNRALGGMLGMLIPFFISLFWVRLDLRRRIVLAGSLVLMATCLILTSTRGAWIGSFTGVSFLGVILNKKVFLFLFLAILLFLLLSPSAQFRRAFSMFNPNDSTIRKRIYLWQSALSMAKEDLLFGKGPGSYKLLYRHYLPKGTLELVRPDHSHAHNIFLHTLAETGIIGLSVLGILLSVVVGWIWKVYKRLSDPWSKAVAIGVLAGVIDFLVHGQVDYTLAGRTGFLFWFYLGLINQLKPGVIEDD